MTRRDSVVVLFLMLVAVAPAAYAAKATPAQSTPLAVYSSAQGVSADTALPYVNGVNGLQCGFSVNGRVATLVTYNTARKMHFVFDSNSPVWQSAGIPSSVFDAEIDLFGNNLYGPYRTMGVGTTARVQADLEFYVGRVTYELDYPNLAVRRVSEDTWVITSDQKYIGCEEFDCWGALGFLPNADADLNVIRRKSTETFGKVNMPIHIEFKLK